MLTLLPGGRLSSQGEDAQAANGSLEIIRCHLINRGLADPTEPAADLLRVLGRALSSPSLLMFVLLAVWEAAACHVCLRALLLTTPV